MGASSEPWQFDGTVGSITRGYRVACGISVGLLLLAACGDEMSPAPKAMGEPSPVEVTARSSAEEVNSAALDCGLESLEVRRQELASGGVWVVVPDPGLGPAELLWREDLNGDGLADLALSFPQAGGNWGDVPVAVYAACAASRYLGVWGPDYAVSVERDEALATRGGQRWNELIVTRREGERSSIQRLEFVNGRYRMKSGRAD